MLVKKGFKHSFTNKYSTVCPRSSDPFYKASYYIKWVTTSWTHSKNRIFELIFLGWGWGLMEIRYDFYYALFIFLNIKNKNTMGT